MAKCVFVFGPESSGSMLVARTLAHALDVAPFGSWDGVGWCRGAPHKVLHRSLPYGPTPVFPDVARLLRDDAAGHEAFVVLTTRDRLISERSRVRRFGKRHAQVARETARAIEIMHEVMAGPTPSCIVSYETLLLLGAPYLQQLYRFVGVESDFVPELHDGNRPYVGHGPLPRGGRARLRHLVLRASLVFDR